MRRKGGRGGIQARDRLVGRALHASSGVHSLFVGGEDERFLAWRRLGKKPFRPCTHTLPRPDIERRLPERAQQMHSESEESQK